MNNVYVYSGQSVQSVIFAISVSLQISVHIASDTIAKYRGIPITRYFDDTTLDAQSVTASYLSLRRNFSTRNVKVPRVLVPVL